MSPKTSRGAKRGKDIGNAGAVKGGKKADGAQKGGKGKGKQPAKQLTKATAASDGAREVDRSVWSTCTNDVRHVQNILERCLRLYMSREEVTTHLQRTANIEPVFTWLVWERLEKDNPEFFEAYYVMVRMKDQIIRFNALLEKYEEGMQQTQGMGKPKKSPPKRGAPAAAGDDAATGKRNKKNVRVEDKEEQPVTNQELGKWADVAGSPFGLGAMPASGMFMNAALNSTSPFPTAVPGLPKTPFSSGLELSADDMYSLMMTPSTLNSHSLAASDLQTDFENHLRSAYAPGSEYRSQLPTDFNLDDIPDFGLSPH